MSLFKKAKKSDAKLRLLLQGIAGGGKTYTALSVAKGIGGKVVLIDTENASASKYADKFDFDTAQLKEFSPQSYLEVLYAAASEGYNTVVIDSLSHSWSGKGGALEMAAAATAKSRSGNSYTAWRDVSPEYNKLIDGIIQAPLNVIATLRSKEEYAQEKGDDGKLKVVKLGLEAISGKGIAYEFDVVLNVEEGGRAIVTKSRYSPISGKVLQRPGEEFGKELSSWLSDGVKEEAIDPAPFFIRATLVKNKTELRMLGEQVKAAGFDSATNANLRAAFEVKLKELES